MFLKKRLRTFHGNQRGGEKDNINTLLILALIVLPLLAVIIFFGKEIKEKAQTTWDEIAGGEGVGPTP